MVRFSVNGKPVSVDVDLSTPLLWVIRENLGLTGTKYGCGMAQCGACTVHIDGEAAAIVCRPGLPGGRQASYDDRGLGRARHSSFAAGMDR